MTIQQYVKKGADQFTKDTGIPFRTAFRTRKGKVSHVIMPADLRVENVEQALQSD